mmetsp:Transcript_90528/g.198351  ORF Transcript_90528/g.198351 Transcript_90528/m.198351 type:complete len:271 (-) Transcript_90528:1968-2780(-)
MMATTSLEVAEICARGASSSSGRKRQRLPVANFDSTRRTWTMFWRGFVDPSEDMEVSCLKTSMARWHMLVSARSGVSSMLSIAAWNSMVLDKSCAAAARPGADSQRGHSCCRALPGDRSCCCGCTPSSTATTPKATSSATTSSLSIARQRAAGSEKLSGAWRRGNRRNGPRPCNNAASKVLRFWDRGAKRRLTTLLIASKSTATVAPSSEHANSEKSAKINVAAEPYSGNDCLCVSPLTAWAAASSKSFPKARRSNSRLSGLGRADGSAE